MDCSIFISDTEEEVVQPPTCPICDTTLDDDDACPMCQAHVGFMQLVADARLQWLGARRIVGVCPICYTRHLVNGACQMCKAEETLLRIIAEIECEEYGYKELGEYLMEEDEKRWEEAERRMAEYRRIPHLKVGDIINFPGEEFGLVKIHSIGHYSYQVHLVYFDGYIKEYIEYPDTYEIEFEDDRLDYIKSTQAPTRSELPWPPDDVSQDDTGI